MEDKNVPRAILDEYEARIINHIQSHLKASAQISEELEMLEQQVVQKRRVQSSYMHSTFQLFLEWISVTQAQAILAPAVEQPEE